MNDMHGAIRLLKEILKKGYKVDCDITDSTWNIPIELKWKIDGFVRDCGEKDDGE